MTDLVHRLRTACSPESPLGKLCSEAASVLDEQINRQMHRAFIAGWMRYDTSRDVAIERGNQEFELWYGEQAPAKSEAEPVAWHVVARGWGEELLFTQSGAEELIERLNYPATMAPLYRVPPDTSAIIAHLEQRVAEAERVIAPFAKLGGIVLGEAPAEAAFLSVFKSCEGDWHTIEFDDFRAAAKWTEAKDENHG